ncbi:hypothetical protein QFZ91_006872 [Paraburkholderia sp. JPY419]
MKAAFEHVDFGRDCSVRVYHRRLPRIPFEWHHHPEYELTLTMNSQGKRYIGDSVATYGADDLVLVPPNLPHTWASNRSIDAAHPQVAIVVWFDGAWLRRLADVCPEYNSLCDLLRRAACGLAFEEGAGARMREHLDRLLSDKPRERLQAALDVLDLLSALPATPLASPSAFDARTGAATGHESDQLNRALALIETKFAHPLRLSALAKGVGAVRALFDAAFHAASWRERRALRDARANRPRVPDVDGHASADFRHCDALRVCKRGEFQPAIQSRQGHDTG